MTVRRLTRTQARQIAVRSQLLTADRPTDLLAMVDQLTLLQIDPTAAVAPNADLVSWSRMGSSYQPQQHRSALETELTLFEHNALIRPMADVGLYLVGAGDRPARAASKQWLHGNDSFRRDILQLLGNDGPVPGPFRLSSKRWPCGSACRTSSCRSSDTHLPFTEL